MQYLLELLQNERRFKVGLFKSEKNLVNFLESIPFMKKNNYKIDNWEYSDYEMDFDDIPKYYELDYKGYIFILSKDMFISNDGKILAIWTPQHEWDIETNLSPAKYIEYNGTQIDAYIIPDSETKSYVEKREGLVEEIKEYYKKEKKCISREFQGSQDGEALYLHDTVSGESKFLFHLDPAIIYERDKYDNLEDFIKEYIY